MARIHPALPPSDIHATQPFRSPANAGEETGVLTRHQDKADLATPWHVMIYNDPVNLMSYVTMVIQRIFGYPEAKARLLMLDVHHKGQCIAWTGAREQAELYVQHLQSHQLLSALRKAAD